MDGCDLELINKFENFIDVPIIYRGGLSSLNDMKLVFKTTVNFDYKLNVFYYEKKGWRHSS